MRAVQSQSHKELRVWERIRIVVGDGADAGRYEARIEDFINGGILVTKPEFVSGQTLLRQGIGVAVQFVRDDAVYEFNSSVHQQGRDGTQRVILTPPRRVRRIQRRLFVRVEMSAKVDFCLLEPGLDWNDWRESFPWQTTFVTDLSAGGIAVKTPDNVTPERVAVLGLDVLTEADLPRYLLGRCVRRFERNGVPHCGIQFILQENIGVVVPAAIQALLPDEFTQFDRHAQDNLATFLFQKQVELRQKGLI